MANSLLVCIQAIHSAEVDGSCRTLILSRYFPSTFLLMESTVYEYTDRHCKDCSGVFWNFYELSNGGFYMSPILKTLMEIDVPFSDLYTLSLSADALGIAACLYAYRCLAVQHPELNYGDFYWHLRDFARTHAEASAIFSAIY